MASAYERELKGILVGDDDVLRDACRSLEPDQEKDYRWTTGNPFLVVRGAGSLGVDLVALRGDMSFPIEVKSASEPTIPFSASSGQYNEQAEEMARECGRAGLIPLYAFRLKGHRGDAWRVFSLPLPDAALQGRSRVLYDRLPKVERTAHGNFILHWEHGLPLHRFFAYLSHLTS